MGMGTREDFSLSQILEERRTREPQIQESLREKEEDSVDLASGSK